jgi:uncharacterized membrane protein
MAETSQNMSDHDYGMHPSRVVALSDGVFAIAMTILVLSIDIPNDTPNDVGSLLNAFSDMSSRFFNFALAFLLLGVFWISHYRKFHEIRRTDDTMLWLNITTLMFVVLIPFSVSAYGDYPDLWPAALFFEGNIMVVGLLQYAQWEYATRGLKLVGPEYETDRITMLRWMNLVTPMLSVIAIGIALTVSPSWSSLVYALIPFIFAYLHRQVGG